MGKKIKLNPSVHSFSKWEDLQEPDIELLKRARLATASAYAPYSGFCVGAALLLENGSIITGSNQENAVYPLGLCAERVALFAAASQHPQLKILGVAVAARSGAPNDLFVPVSPCGGCRQVLLEYERKQGSRIRVIFTSPVQEVLVADSAATLLPFGFDSSNLSHQP